MVVLIIPDHECGEGSRINMEEDRTHGPAEMLPDHGILDEVWGE